MPESTDIFVIGGGPAGLGIAIAARQQGFRVMVADGAQPPIDKACGEGLLPDGIAALEKLGVQIPLSDGLRFRGIRFLSSDLSAEAEFSGRSFGLALRRTTLHRILMEHAAEHGAELRWRSPVSGIDRDAVRLNTGTVRARWIIGADGSTSRVRRWAGLEGGPKPRLRYAFRRHYRAAPWSDHMEVYWGRDCQGYATAVSGEQVCVALASGNPAMRLEDGLKSLPALRARLKNAETISTERGCLTGNRTYRGLSRGNVVLIGDASGTVDAITGEGLGLAFSQAVVLADCLRTGDLRRYEREHRRLALRPAMMARLMLRLDGKPRLQRRTLQVFRQRPHIFERLLELHVGARSPFDVALDGLTLGWGLLTTSA